MRRKFLVGSCIALSTAISGRLSDSSTESNNDNKPNSTMNESIDELEYDSDEMALHRRVARVFLSNANDTTVKLAVTVSEDDDPVISKTYELPPEEYWKPVDSFDEGTYEITAETDTDAASKTWTVKDISDDEGTVHNECDPACHPVIVVEDETVEIQSAQFD